MSEDCGHGWGAHLDGPQGPCYRCEVERLRAERDALLAEIAKGQGVGTAELDWDRLGTANRALDPAHQWAFDKLAENAALLRLVKRAAEWGEDCGEFCFRHCCQTRDYKPHADNCEFKAAIDAAKGAG